MRAIAKGPEPPSLTTHRQTSHCDYDNYPAKNALRQALVTEQRGLCCYCMGRIHPNENTMKIEHWKCQARYPDEQLSYRNLLGACFGGEGGPHKDQHCDTKKGDRDLRWNPADPERDIASRLGYRTDGAIVSDDPEFNSQLNDVLNLNRAALKNNRKKILDAILDWWTHRGPVPKRRIEQKIDKYALGSSQLTPYCQVAIWWLSHKLACMP